MSFNLDAILTPQTYRIDTFHWSVHFGYWIINVLGWVLLSLAFTGEYYESFINKMGYLPSQLIVTYGLLYLVIPYLVTKRYLRAIVTVVIMTYVAMALARVLKIYFYEPLVDPSDSQESLVEILTEPSVLLLQYFIWCYLVPMITITILIVINHLRERTRIAELIKQKNIAELNSLKAQIHPHFLFNTLNNLYTLAIQKSPETTQVARRLHDILNYMFHRYEDQHVLITAEIDLLKNYIELERIRYGDRLRLTFEENLDTTQFALSPLILLTLVENAFKHGASKDIDHPHIAINISASDTEMIFSVHNSKPQSDSQVQVDIHSGIGLSNVKRQLELVYGADYTLDILDREEVYTVTLRLSANLLNAKEDTLSLHPKTVAI